MTPIEKSLIGRTFKLKSINRTPKSKVEKSVLKGYTDQNYAEGGLIFESNLEGTKYWNIEDVVMVG